MSDEGAWVRGYMAMAMADTARETEPYLRPAHDTGSERYPGSRVPYLIRTQHAATFEGPCQSDQAEARRDQAVCSARILVHLVFVLFVMRALP